MTTVSIADLEYASRSNGFEKDGVSGALAGAIGGAGVGLLTQALRPKDRDQNGFKEYLISALTGAGLGGAAGFAYDNLASNRFTPEMPKKKDSKPDDGPKEKIIPLPQDTIAAIAENGGPNAYAEIAYNKSMNENLGLYASVNDDEKAKFDRALAVPGEWEKMYADNNLASLYENGGVGAVVDESKKSADGTHPIAQFSPFIMTRQLVDRLVPPDRQELRDELYRYCSLPVYREGDYLYTVSIFKRTFDDGRPDQFIYVPDSRESPKSKSGKPIFRFDADH